MSRAGIGGPEVEPIEDLADGHAFVDQPPIKHIVTRVAF